MVAVAGSALHFRRRHPCFLDQIVDITIAVVVTAAQSAIVIVLSAGVTGVCGNFLDKPLDLLRRCVLHNFAIASIVQVIGALVQHWLLVIVCGLNRMDSHGAHKALRSGNQDIVCKADIRVVQMADEQPVQTCKKPIL